MKQYKAPNAELLLFATDDVLNASDDFQLKIDWFDETPVSATGADDPAQPGA